LPSSQVTGGRQISWSWRGCLDHDLNPLLRQLVWLIPYGWCIQIFMVVVVYCSGVGLQKTVGFSRKHPMDQWDQWCSAIGRTMEPPWIIRQCLRVAHRPIFFPLVVTSSNASLALQYFCDVILSPKTRSLHTRWCP
jgi:hypothetical protein